MKLIPPVIWSALILAAGAVFTPGLAGATDTEAASAAPPAQQPAAEKRPGLDGWDKVELQPTGVPPATIDAEAAKALARKNGCFRCHDIDRIKTGPAFDSVSDAYKGKLEAGEKREYSHLTDGDILVLGGKINHHRVLETDPPNDPVQLKNLVYWILLMNQHPDQPQK